MKRTQHAGSARRSWRALAGCACVAMALQVARDADPLKAVADATIPDRRHAVCSGTRYRQALRVSSVPDQPNILLIMLDDLDLTDVGVYREPATDCEAADDGVCIATPALDELAEEGVRFTHYCANGAVCSPTRVSILTGHYPARFGFKRGLRPSSWRGIPGNVDGIAERLQSVGYRTGHIGKWHVGANRDDFLPACKGFDFAVRRTSGEYLDFTLDVNGETVPSDPGDYLTSVLTDYAVAFAQEDPGGQPFFLNLWYHTPHSPLTVPPELPPGFPDYDFDTPRERLAAMVAVADFQIGRLIQEVRQIPNTLVIFTSDNGGTELTHDPAAPGNNGLIRNLRGYKGEVFEGGIRVPMIVWGPGIVPSTPGGFVNESVIGSFDLYSTFVHLAGIDPEALDAEGESFVELLADPTLLKTRASPLVWESKIGNLAPSGPLPPVLNTYAVRDGHWKLVHYFDEDDAPHDGLFDLANDPAEAEDVSGAHPAIVAELRARYEAWRREVGDISYELEVSESGVTCQRSRVFTFDGTNGVVTIPFVATDECDEQDTRFDFHDGDFSFVTWITPTALPGGSVIAEREGSWLFGISADAQLYLRLRREGHEDCFEVSGPSVTSDTPSHVAFTVFGWKSASYTVRLFINGAPVAEATDPLPGPQAVAHGDSPITIGNDAQGTAPFTGDIWQPLMSALSLYPSEIFATRVGEACLADINEDGTVDLADLEVVLGQYGSAGPDGDVNCDGSVNLADLATLLGEFGETCW